TLPHLPPPHRGEGEGPATTALSETYPRPLFVPYSVCGLITKSAVANERLVKRDRVRWGSPQRRPKLHLATCVYGRKESERTGAGGWPEQVVLPVVRCGHPTA